jgi:hypothetical protein
MHAINRPGRRLVARHLRRLSHTLETFGTRLREAVSSAVGETVCAIVRETMHALLADQQTLPGRAGQSAQPAYNAPPLWARQEGGEDEPWFDDPDSYLTEEHDTPPDPRTQHPAGPPRWPQALAIGLHTTLGWLRQRVGRYPVLTALAVGFLTALATYLGGPMAAAVVGLAGSACNLLSLTETMHTSADTLAAFGTS